MNPNTSPEGILDRLLTPPITASCRLMSWALRVRDARRPVPLPYPRTGGAPLAG